MCKKWIDPWEKPLHDIYEKESMFISNSIFSLFILQTLIQFLEFHLYKCL